MIKSLLLSLLMLCFTTTFFAQQQSENQALAVVNSISYREIPVTQTLVDRFQVVRYQYTLSERLVVMASIYKYASNGSELASVSQNIINPAQPTTETPVAIDADIYIPPGAVPSAQLPNGQYYQWEISIRTAANVLIMGVKKPLTILGNGLATTDFSKNQFSVYPNPVAETLYFSEALSFQDITISDATGKVVLRQANSAAVDVSALQAGMYFVTTDKHQRIKFVKK